MSESAYNSPMVHRRLTESCCSSPARSIGSRITDILTDSDGEDEILFTEVPGTPEQTIMAGWLKFRDNKKWKQRWGVITKLSPAADKEDAVKDMPKTKIKSAIEFWSIRRTKRWFCNRPLSPPELQSENIKILQNVIISGAENYENKENIHSNTNSKEANFNSNIYQSPQEPNLSSNIIEWKSDISTPSDPFECSGDSSYKPSVSEVSSLELEFTPPDIDIYTPPSFPIIEKETYTNENNKTNIEDNNIKVPIETVGNETAVKSETNNGNGSPCKKSKELKNHCYYCETDVTNFARHLNNNHSKELDVIKIMSMPVNSLQKKRLLAKLRNKGNYLKTANNCQRRVRRAQIPGNANVLPCSSCLGFFSSKLLYRHKKICDGNSKKAQSQGQSTLVNNIRIDKRLRLEVFPRMRADKVSLEAKSDHLICAFGARYLRIHRDKHFAVVTSRKMRELSRIFIELKKMEPQIKTFFQALQPKFFDLFVKATQIVARYDAENDIFGAPSLAMNIVNSFKQCCDIAINFVLKGSNNYETIPCAEAEAQLKTMLHLFTANWRFEVSSQAANNLHLNNWNKTTIVPLASDLKILRSYLISSSEKVLKKLSLDGTDIASYNTLVECIYCRVLLLNKRRPGELQRMLLSTYLKCGNDEGRYEEFDRIITPSERILLNRFKRVVIRGKRGRGVPVLFGVEVQDHAQVMLKIRSNLVPKENLYFFAKANSTSEISGYKVISKYAKQCGAKNPSSITSTRLRKHLATLTQIFNMTDNDIEQLATFMGHTTGVHRGSYRLPDDVYQTAKLSKLLLLMENGEADIYKGKSLDEIELDMEKDLLDEEKEKSDDDSDEEVPIEEMDFIYEKNKNSNTFENNKKINKNCISDEGNIKKKGGRILIPWSEKQKELARAFFKDHIKNAKPPKRMECEELIEKHPDIFHNKNWLKIKVFIQNEYNKKK